MKKPKCIFAIGIDGAMGSVVRSADTPNIDRVISDGVVSYTAQAVLPSASYQNWGSFLHGVDPKKHQIGGENPIREDVDHPSFLKVLQQNDPDLKCGAFSCWNPINTNIIEKSIKCDRVSLPDPELAIAAADYIRENRPDLFFMQFDFVDAAGHRYGYGSDEYIKQIETNDAEIGLVIDAIREIGIYDESLIVIVSDHGGFGTGHGGDEPECLEILWAIRGPGIAKGIELGDQISIMDTPTVILRAFDLPIPIGYDGKIPDGVFA